MSKLSNAETVSMVEQYLTQKYEIRTNVLSKKIELRSRDTDDFLPLTDKHFNSIVRHLRLDLDEIASPKQHVEEFLYSDDVVKYDPIQQWLSSLPEWDGQDRIDDLFRSIPGISDRQLAWYRIWMRSVVAHWLQMDTLHGNECVPTLIGAQGCGKSTFCQRLLPPHLRVYYLDHINLANKFDKEIALTNSLLVNIDELDQIKPGQMASLKHTLSRTKVNSRPIFGREQEERARYASFVATTNNPHPLHDPTGSRRYICIQIPKGQLIDNDSVISYDQLYAQVMTELTHKQLPYWFTNEETLLIQQTNAPFYQQQDLVSMFDACFRIPAEGETGEEMSLHNIIDIMSDHFPQLNCSHAVSCRIGRELKNRGCQSKETRQGTCYRIIQRSVA